MKSEAEIRKTIQKIDEVVEAYDGVIELLKLKYMKLQIKLARVKAEARAKKEGPRESSIVPPGDGHG